MKRAQSPLEEHTSKRQKMDKPSTNDTEQSWEGANSRLLATVDKETLRKLQGSSVFIVGVRGLGVEIAKNLILMGVAYVTIHDNENVLPIDLSSNFFLEEKHIDKNRAECVLPKLRDLNEKVQVHIHTGIITEELLRNYKVIVVTSCRSRDTVQLNNWARNSGSCTIICDSLGLFGYCFVDFGNDFVVKDETGEPPKSANIVGISNDEKAMVMVQERHDLSDNDTVILKEVEGMTEVNDKEYKIKVIGPNAFQIDVDSRNFGVFSDRQKGIFEQVKTEKHLSFKSLESYYNQKIPFDKFVMTDGAKMLRTNMYWIFIQALQQFHDEKKRMPQPYSEEDAALILELGEKIKGSETPDEWNEAIFKLLAKTCSGDISPMASVLGGYVSQQCITAVSGKYTPTNQWLFLEQLECLPKEPVTKENLVLSGSRYDGQISVFGNAFQETLANLKYFIVGAGAIGCEILKTFAMMGVGSGPKGKVNLTDLDTIEISNLNRQFLYRKWHLGKFKSHVAAEAINVMNPSINLHAVTIRVGPETEEFLDDEFWESLDGVANALDTFSARLYVDSRCVFYKKPLVEGGTEGTKGNVQVVVPDLTESYGASKDPEGGNRIQLCTLHNFPNKIEHCLAWAREVQFEGHFVEDPNLITKYKIDPSFLNSLQPAAKLLSLHSLQRTLVHDGNLNSISACATWAYRLFERLFDHTPQELLQRFPIDYVEEGAPFWAGTKRPPSPIKFSPDNPLHFDFVLSAAVLKAYSIGLIDSELKTSHDFPQIEISVRKVISELSPLPFVSKHEAKTSSTTSSDVSKFATPDGQDEAQAIFSTLPPSGNIVWNPKSVNFEKDDDNNFHIDFIHAASTLRALNYSIVTDFSKSSRLNSKIIAGRIMPAIVTTTAVVAGLECFEVYKVIQKNRKIEDFKNAFVSLGIPQLLLSEPLPPAKHKYYKKEVTEWDRVAIKPPKDLTLQALLAYFKKKLYMTVTSLSVGTACIYLDVNDDHKARLKSRLVPLVEQVAKIKFSPKQKWFELVVTALSVSGEPLTHIPKLYYWIPSVGNDVDDKRNEAEADDKE